MPELLLEVGCEELPASFVRRASQDLLENVSSLLGDAGVLNSAGIVYGTPRRLIVSFPDLSDRQADSIKEVRGPGLKGAYDADGKPTQALLGFCKGQGVSPEALRKDDQYVWVSKPIVGRETISILAEILPKAIRSMNFDKTMRWGSSRMRFARPIRRLLACFNEEVVPFEIEGVISGCLSAGHRFYSPETFEARNLVSLLGSLRDRKVEPDAEIRRHRIIEQATQLSSDIPDLTEALIEENVYLTEWPTPILGEFRSEYMALPVPVLVTAMAKHEKMFPIKDQSGKLTNKFIFIRNSGEDETVRRGAEWVLNARFNDAKFFYDEDSKHNLDYFLEKTEGILFQEKLGSVRKRADRLSKLSEYLALETGAIGRELEFARKAGLYAKADLSTGLVSELSSLQGVIGGAYARREGVFGSIAWAIETQYDISKNEDPGDCSGERASIRLSMADQLDKLAGYLGIGQEPSGSSDPYGLRRAATILIEAAWMWPSSIPSYEPFFQFALKSYQEQGIELNEQAALKSFVTVLSARYTSMLADVRHDILEAALVADKECIALSPRKVKVRCECVSRLGADVSFVQTATRPLNIVAAAVKKNFEFDTTHPLDSIQQGNLDSAEGVSLFEALTRNASILVKAVQDEDCDKIVECLQTLTAPINRFFESTMVMAEQVEVRYARLSLMQATAQQLLLAGDFSKLVIEG